MEAIPLTDLCAICHVNPIKYTCPRDGIHTCSLPCVKRHKKWAQCSGVRDPAEYRKRSELATPASIDKDFNFITRVERSLSRADDVAVARGLDLVPARLKQHDARSKFEVEVEARGIKITRAPKAFSRSKQNKTHWAGQPNCINWSVEWLLPDGRRVLTVAQETKSIKDLHVAATRERKSHKKRKWHSDADEVHGATSTTANGSSRSPREKGNCAIKPAPTGSKSDSQPQPVSGSETHPRDLHFYLHRPHTESRFKCLIPLPPTDSLHDSLDNRTLIEFPTIHVRTESPDKLPAPFITEEEYTRRHGDDIPINVVVPATHDHEEERKEDEDSDMEEGEISTLLDVPANIGQAKVLEVLAKDLGG